MPVVRSTLEDAAYRAYVDHIAALRRKQGVTQVELAAKLGQPQSFVSKTERYARRIDPAEFRAWVLAIGADPAQEYAAVSLALSVPTDEELLAGDSL